MKKAILIVLFSGVAFASVAQSVFVSYEYWFDNDYSNMVSNSITPSSTFTLSSSIPLTGLSIGGHTFNIRFLNDSGCYSSTASSFFYNSSQNISGYEYWFDEDYANRISQAVTSVSSFVISQATDINSLSPGFHNFSIRFQSEVGDWSSVSSDYFFRLSNSGLPNSVSCYRYWFDDGDTALVNLNLPVPLQVIQIADSLDANSLSVGPHKIHVQFRDTSQLWSSVFSQDFFFCLTGLPVPDFNYIVSGNDVVFSNQAQNSSSFKWFFDDGDSSSISNPLHHFDSAGVYNVCLVAMNECNPLGDTICKTVSIQGLTAIHTNRGGNTGAVSVHVYGGGFVPGIELFLRKQGEQNIYGDTLIIKNLGLITTGFDLTNKTIGQWDVVAVYPTADTSVLINGFTIEQGADPQLWINLTGDYALRIGFNQIYTVTYGNSGNTDAVAVPLWLSGIPQEATIEIVSDTFSLTGLSGLDSIGVQWDSIPSLFYDSTTNTLSDSYIIPKIAAGEIGTFQFIIHLAGNTPIHADVYLKVNLDKPLLSSVAGLRLDESTEFGLCIGDLVKLTLQAFLQGSGVSSLTQCISNLVVEFPYDFIKYSIQLSDNETSGTKKFIKTSEIIHAFITKNKKCLLDLGITFVAPESVILKTAYRAWRLYSAGQSGYNLDMCAGKLAEWAVTHFLSQTGNSIDPNEKYGPQGSINHYININNPLSYVINFENDTAANLPAQSVTVIDSLNSAFYDYSSFGFSSVTIGDSVFVLNYPSKSFFHDFDFNSQYGVKARVIAEFDSVSGIAIWSFYTIDTATNQITSNALAGFLPPDTLSPKGQGYVSFIVKPNPAILTGASICNKATIIFDTNSPITTSCWENIFDLVKPQSEVSGVVPIQTDSTFVVSWNGSDNLSGIRNYTLYFSDNGGLFIPYTTTSNSSAAFTGIPGHSYFFYTIARDSAGNIEDAPLIPDDSTVIITSVNDISEGGQTMLFQNRPNPFSNSTTIDFYLHQQSDVSIKITDLRGHKILEIKLWALTPGKHAEEINLNKLSSGIYYYQMISSDFTETKKMIHLR